MNKNSTFYYSIHNLEEDSEEECLIDMDDVMSINTSSYEDVNSLLEQCQFCVSDTIVQELFNYARSLSNH
ncbi:MAG: hypothetical protein JXB49_27385 [Bacteroidales bacterium]|nr:hypothetical protein [Bacteroidales bacterium]